MKLPFFSKQEPEEEVDESEQYTELAIDNDQAARMRIFVEKLDGLSSVDKIMRNVRNGGIVVANIKDLKEANTEELKHCISRMRTACLSIEGDIAGAGEEWVIVTPNDVRIHRGGPAEDSPEKSE